MNDLSTLSNDDLLRLHRQYSAPQVMPDRPPSGMTDAELADAYAAAQASAQPKQQRPFTLADTWPARIAQSVWSGVTLPGDVYQGKATVPQSENMPGGEDTSALTRVMDLASIASPVNPAVRAGDRAWAGVAKATRPTNVPTAEALKEAADQGYKTAREMGVDIAPVAIKNMSHTIQGRLEQDGVLDTLAPKTFAILKKLQSPPEGSVATIANIEAARRALGHAAADFTNPTERLAAGRAISGMDDFVANLPEGSVLAGPAAAASRVLEKARGNYAAAMRSDKVTGAVDRADLNAAVANSGQNIDNAIRQRMRDLLVRPKESRGFSPEEVAQMERVARGTVPTNAARIIGNLLGGGGGLGGAISAGLGAAGGAAAGGPPGAIVGATAPVFGYSAKKLANALTKHQADKLGSLVRMRSPLFQEAGEAAVISPDKRAVLIRALMLGRPKDEKR